MLVVDYETHLFLKVLPKIAPAWAPIEVKKAEGFLRERAEMVRAGVRRCPTWFQEELNSIESRLRCWWDAWKEEWVIDRLQDEGVVQDTLNLAKVETAENAQALRKSAESFDGPYYLTIMHFKPGGEFQLDRKLLDALRSSDMQRHVSPAAWQAEQDAKAEKIEAANGKAGTDIALAGVDKLSAKSAETMVKVFDALATGETIIAHGDDAKVLQRVEDERKRGILPDPTPHTLTKRKKRQ